MRIELTENEESTLIMKVETAVQCFRMWSGRFSGHDNSIPNIIPQLKKKKNVEQKRVT